MVGRYLATHSPIPPEAYEGRVVSQVPLPELDGPIADLTSNLALRVGVTGEIGSVDDYFLTTEWAAAARSDAFGGLIYHAKYTLNADVALALFGAEGAHPDRAVTSSRPFADVLTDIGYDLARSALPSPAAVSTRVDDTVEPEEADD